MSARHRLLRRQLATHLGPEDEWPDGLRRFVELVNEAYCQSDADRALLERSLELSSQELLQANTDLRAVMQAFPDLFLWLSPDGTVLECRGQDCELLQVPPKALVGWSIRDLPDREAAARFWHALQEVAAGAPLRTVEYSVTRQGVAVHCEARILRLHDRQVLAIVRDITPHVAAERELERSVSLLRATLEATPDGILVVTAQGTISSFNQKFVDLWRIPEPILRTRDDNAVLQSVLDQLSDPAAFLAKVRELYRDPEAEAFDELRLADGRIFERYSMPQRLGGVVVGRVWSFRDVTPRRRAEAALHERDEQLRQAQKMEAVGLLAGGIAHDFNNLLTAINGYSELVFDELDAGHPCRSDVQEIRKAGESAASLTRQLLAFSRRQILQPQVLDLNTIVSRTDSMLRRLIGEHIVLESRLSDAIYPVSVDPGQIEQIIINLAVNARDAMPDGGRLIIETTNVDDGVTEGCSSQERLTGPYVMLTVTDTGTGMDQQMLEHIFEPFFTTKKRGEGTGLGLATVYGIVKQSGGVVCVSSEPGRGTTFRICFPRAAEPDRALLEETAARPRGGTETILLVEDQPEVRSVVASILARYSYRVLAAASGAEALRAAESYPAPIDLLLTDVVMPEMSGPELANRLMSAQSGLRVLFASGYADEMIDKHRMRESDVAFIQKPFSPTALLEKIRDVLDGGELAA